MKPFEVIKPTSIEEAIEALRHYGESARVIAGGTALTLLMRQGLYHPQALINLNTIPTLTGIKSNESGSWSIGALSLHRDIEHDTQLRGQYPALVEMAHYVANPQVRNMGTIGGNLCHADPASDPPTALIAAGAEAVVQGHSGERFLPVESLCRGYYENSLAPDEILTSIRLPTPASRSGMAYLRYTTTTLEDRPFVCVSVGLALAEDGKTCVDARVGVGAVSPSPVRASRVEEVLKGQEVSEELLREAAEYVVDGVEPIDDVRGPASYRLEMAKVFFRRSAEKAWTLARKKL